MNDTAISTDHLVKRYGNVTAVDGLSLRVARGEIYAFLGLNGAGKTTTIRMLLGMIKPTSGSVNVLGVPIRRGEKKPCANSHTRTASPFSCRVTLAPRRVRGGNGKWNVGGIHGHKRATLYSAQA